MKTYFCKYIPVEGEIEIGDMYFFGKALLKKTEEKYQRNCKKAKLFLCSRDIKIGDTVKILGGSNNDYDIKFKDELNSGADWYKVIGEISPEAIWVKEGDEFSIEDIQLWVYNHNSQITRTTVMKEYEVALKSSEKYRLNPIKIKCPTCKQYH